MIRNNFAGDDEITLRISNEASETLANAYACVASVNQKTYLGMIEKSYEKQRLRCAASLRNDALGVSNRKCTTENETHVKFLQFRQATKVWHFFPKDSRFDKARLDLLEKHLKIASDVAVRDEKMRSEACAFRAKALIFCCCSFER